MATPVNPDDEIFWRTVREAHDMISSDNQMRMDFSIGDKKALVYCAYATDGAIIIEVTPFVPDPPTLIVPPGGSEPDA